MSGAIVAERIGTIPRAREFEYARVWRGALIAAGTAACLNLVVYFIAHAAGVAFTGRFSPGAQETLIAFTDVLGASIIWVVPASAGLLILNHFMDRPSRVFVPLATAFGVLSIAGPFTFPEASLGTRLALTAMHVILTAAIVGAIGLWARTSRNRA
jgi:uncharacterized protein DUF6069